MIFPNLPNEIFFENLEKSIPGETIRDKLFFLKIRNSNLENKLKGMESDLKFFLKSRSVCLRPHKDDTG